jgi:LPXTG-motif cell wall-anchored protein
MAHSPWWNFLDQIVAEPFMAGLSPFITAGIVLAALLLLGWVFHRRRKRSGS